MDETDREKERDTKFFSFLAASLPRLPSAAPFSPNLFSPRRVELSASTTPLHVFEGGNQGTEKSTSPLLPLHYVSRLCQFCYSAFTYQMPEKDTHEENEEPILNIYIVRTRRAREDLARKSNFFAPNLRRSGSS